MAEDAKPSNPSQTRPQYIAALAATGGALAAGTALGWTSPVNHIIENVNSEYGFFITKSDFSMISSAVTLGAAIICLVIGPIIQILGRKLTMLLLVIPFTIGWSFVTWATNLPMLIAGRFLLGISGGAFCVTAPTYTGEIAQSNIRGTLGSYFQLMLVIGVLFSYVIGSRCSVFMFNIICLCIPIIFGIVFKFMPETPSYLISKGKHEEAAASLKWLRGKHYDCNEEMAELKAQFENDQKNKGSLMAALSRRPTIKAFNICLGLMFFQQMSGINAVIFYTKDIFDAADTGIDSSIASIIVAIMQVISVLISSIIVDKLGRRLLLLPSALVMTVCHITIGYYFYMQDSNKESVAVLGWIPIVSLCAFIVLFSIGFGPIPWMMMGELFANDIKGVAGSIAGAFNWGLAFLVTLTFQDMKSLLGNGQTFWLFAGFCLVALLFVFFFVPETKGKSLADIQRMLAGEKVLNIEQNKQTAIIDSKF